MSLLSRTAHSATPHARPIILTTTTAARRAIGASSPITSPSTSSSPCSGRRGFHLASTVGDTIRMTADAFSWVHSTTGMPWYLTIPLLAVGVNATLRFPLQVYTAHLRERRNELAPLVTAWARRHVATVGRDGQGNKVLDDRILRLRTASSIEKSRRRIYKTWGTQRWKGMAPLVGIFPFVAISEALRRKCGAPVGWISNSVGLGSPDSATSNLGAASSLFDHSLAEGGCLWFTDLTSMDPYYGLPLICTGILVWNTWGRMSREHLQALLTIQPDDSKVISLTRLQKLLGRTMLLIPVFPLLFADLPSAIFLYWGSSFALTSVNEAILGRLIPKKMPRLHAEHKTQRHWPFLRGPKQPPSGRNSGGARE
ncbi:hypothetical protein ACJ41O_011634 [Fusarium nematophilum]